MIKKYQVNVDRSFYQFKRFYKYDEAMESQDYYLALEYVKKKVSDLNKKIEEEKPWELYKKASAASEFDLKTDKRTKFDELFKVLISELMMVADWLYPFMPEKALEIERQLKELEPRSIFPKIE
jgi:methionyl-tRNA synthetase